MLPVYYGLSVLKSIELKEGSRGREIYVVRGFKGCVVNKYYQDGQINADTGAWHLACVGEKFVNSCREDGRRIWEGDITMYFK